MNPAEYSDVMLGYFDLDTGEEHYVDLPEIASSSLIPECFEKRDMSMQSDALLTGVSESIALKINW